MKAILSKYRQFAAMLLAALLVGIDQFTKWLVYSNMEINTAINLIKIGDTEVLNLYYCTNDGAAFSMMENKTFFLIAVTSVVIIGLTVGLLTKKIHRAPYVVSFSLIIGGGIGNLVDRLFNGGKVVDFIDFRLINFPIFNFADICAVVGGILLCLFVIIDEVKDSKAKKAQKSAPTENPDNGEPSSDGND